MIEYLVYMRLCRTAYPPSHLVVFILRATELYWSGPHLSHWMRVDSFDKDGMTVWWS
jgi:hypothetical protein